MPQVLAGVNDLLFRTRIEQTARKLGIEILTAEDDESLSGDSP